MCCGLAQSVAWALGREEEVDGREDDLLHDGRLPGAALPYEEAEESPCAGDPLAHHRAEGGRQDLGAVGDVSVDGQRDLVFCKTTCMSLVGLVAPLYVLLLLHDGLLPPDLPPGAVR